MTVNRGPRFRYRFRWWHVPLFLIGLVFCCVLIIWVPVAMGWDLEPVHERAEELGIAYGDARKPQTLSPPARRDVFLSLKPLLDDIGTYRHDSGEEFEVVHDEWEHRFRLPSEAMRAWHVNEFDVESFGQLLAILEELGEDPIVFLDRCRPFEKDPNYLDAIGLFQDIALTLSERIRIAPGPECCDIIDAGLRNVQMQRDGMLLGCLVRIASLFTILEAIPSGAAGLEGLAAADERQLAHRLRSIRRTLRPQLHEAFEWEFDMNYTSLTMEPGKFASLAGHRHSSWYIRYFYLARADELMLFLDRLSVLEDEDWVQWVQTFQREDREFQREHGHGIAAWLPRVLVSRMIANQAFPLAMKNTVRAELRINILLAALTGTEWPIDPWSKSGERVRTLTCDSHLLGVYSIGEDGRDDGGDPHADDVCWLYGQIDEDETTVIWHHSVAAGRSTAIEEVVVE